MFLWRLARSSQPLVLKRSQTLSTRSTYIGYRHSSSSVYDKFSFYEGRPIPANKQRFIPQSGTYPTGFLVGSIRAGIKDDSNNQPDLVLVASERPESTSSAAVFTKNEFCAASITISRELLRQQKGVGIAGVIANSGCANTLTGQAGLNDAKQLASEAASYLPRKRSRLMVMHTGRGAARLPMQSILHHLPSISSAVGGSHEHWLQAAVALCTTDTFPKLMSRSFTLSSGKEYRLAGITKGAGMVHPNMATTLGIICTDLAVEPSSLQVLLSRAAARSYNCISIDGDTSTNDMVAMFANGADQPALSEAQTEDFAAFQHILNDFMAEMAQLVVRDAEGASKFITIRIRGSPDEGASKLIAQAIARSVLLKTSFYGNDPGWHGILAAIGYALADTQYANTGVVVPSETSVSFVDGETGEHVIFFDNGVPVEVDDAKIKQLMSVGDLETIVHLRRPRKIDAEAVYWTCDMTHDFISLNSGVSR